MKLKRKLLLLSLTILSAFCLLFGIVVLPKPVSHVAQAATLDYYDDSELSAYNVVDLSTIALTEPYVFNSSTVTTTGTGIYDKSYPAMDNNPSFSVVFKFNMTHVDVTGAEKIVVLRSYNGAYGYRFYLDTLRIGVLNNWAMTTVAEPIELIKAGQEYSVEFGAINLKDSTNVWLFIKIDGKLVQSVVTEQIDNTYNNRRMTISTSSSTGFTLKMPTKVLPMYEDNELSAYNEVDLTTIAKADPYVVTAGNTYDKSYPAMDGMKNEIDDETFANGHFIITQEEYLKE